MSYLHYQKLPLFLFPSHTHVQIANNEASYDYLHILQIHMKLLHRLSKSINYHLNYIPNNIPYPEVVDETDIKDMYYLAIKKDS
jgi:hypothetical protein